MNQETEQKFSSLMLQVSTSIWNLRRRRGLTQKQLAEKMNIQRSVITFIEGPHANPTLKVLTKFANFFEVKVTDLFIYSRRMIERMEPEEFGEKSFSKNGITLVQKSLAFGEVWNYELKAGRQVFIKAWGGYAKATAEYLGSMDIINMKEIYRVPGGGTLEIKGFDERARAEILLIETALQEGR
jgi:putative transcriptional regulator